jgi:hypothetical protein
MRRTTIAIAATAAFGTLSIPPGTANADWDDDRDRGRDKGGSVQLGANCMKLK